MLLMTTSAMFSDVENNYSDFSLVTNLMQRITIFSVNASVLIELDTAGWIIMFNSNIAAF